MPGGSHRAYSVLVGLDGHDAAWRALQRALELCGYGSRLTVLFVDNGRDEAASAVEGVRDVLARVERQLFEQFATATLRETRGDPATELVRLARELDVDLLVVGHNNHAYRRPAGLGPVSERLVHEPPCDILVVK
jgi:nucleotide-binding universal stress UspA family protein